MKTSRLLACALLLSATAIAAWAENEKPEKRILTVTGQDSVSIPATHARVSVMIESRDKTASAASSQTGAASQKVLDSLKKSNVGRLQTGGLAVNPIFSPKKVISSYAGPEETEISGYLAQWTASFEVPVERAGNIVTDAIELGVSRVTQFELKATDEATAAAQRDALKLAATRARADADAVLEALGYTATEIVKIQVNGSSGGPVGRGMVAMAYSAKSAPALEGGVEEITGSVTLEVAY
ncbi:MAG TPA: SIMPL domain-containing protein [Opitutaceae bacterium]